LLLATEISSSVVGSSCLELELLSRELELSSGIESLLSEHVDLVLEIDRASLMLLDESQSDELSSSTVVGSLLHQRLLIE